MKQKIVHYETVQKETTVFELYNGINIEIEVIKVMKQKKIVIKTLNLYGLHIMDDFLLMQKQKDIVEMIG